MTCQVVLANGHGIALASDTTVTVGSSRTFEMAPKVFPLTLPHRVAVLHAGSVNFHGIPYGVLIGEWARSLGDIQLRYVEAYRESFIGWLRDNVDRAAQSNERDWDAIESLSGRLEDLWRSLKRHLESIPEDQHKWATHQFIKTETEELNDRDDLVGQNEAKASAIADHLWGLESESTSLSRSLNYWFDDVPRTDEIDFLLRDFIRLQIQKNATPSGVATVSIVGFGSEEFYGNLSQAVIGGAIGRELCFQSYLTSAVNMYWPHQLFEFVGQSDAISEFLRGYSEAIVSQGMDRVETPLYSEDDSVGNAIEDDPRESFRMNLMREVERISQEGRLSAFRSTIASLPLHSLAEVAKTLVGLQALKLMVSSSTQSVSKESEVALITRSEGFTWLLRSS